MYKLKKTNKQKFIQRNQTLECGLPAATEAMLEMLLNLILKFSEQQLLKKVYIFR